MNWEAISAVGEILGAAAVVITLAYLVVQLRLNTTAIRAQTRSSITDQALAMSNTIISTPELLDAEVKAAATSPIVAGSPVQDKEQRLLFMYCMGWFRVWENHFYQYRLGTFDESEFLAYRNSWTEVLQIPLYRETWEQIGSQFSPEFVAEIDSILIEVRRPTQE